MQAFKYSTYLSFLFIINLVFIYLIGFIYYVLLTIIKMGKCVSREDVLHDEAINIKSNRDKIVKAENMKFLEKLNQLKLESPNINIEKILNATVVELVNMLNQGSVTSEALIIIFGQRASSIGLEYEMITETNFQRAILKAKQCDAKRKSSGLRNWTFNSKQKQFLPPLFGIPISIKDTIDQEGFASTIGLTVRYARKQMKDGFMLQVLNNSGMIPFVRSNVPQIAMTFQSHNFLWGRALNPWNKLRAVGGSSGGQCALIASRCSPIGVGSDVGGSLRIPAELCGVYSLKPSSRRIPFKGHTIFSPTFSGQINISTVMGPMGKSVEDLALWLKILTTTQYYNQNPDPYIKIIPFQDSKYRSIPKKLRIGYFDSLNYIGSTNGKEFPILASKRAVKQVIQALQKHGHETIKIEIPDQKEVILLFYEIVLGEGEMRGPLEMLQGQTLIPQFNQINTMTKIPNFLFDTVASIVSRLKPRGGQIMKRCKGKSAYQYLITSDKQNSLKQKFYAMWKKNKLDIIISPGFGCQAPLHGYSDQITIVAAYTFIWNVLEMTAGAVPITRVREDEEIYTDKFDDNITAKIVECTRNSRGLPVGIQVVGLPFQEEIVLRSMKLIQQLFPFYKQNNYPI